MNVPIPSHPSRGSRLVTALDCLLIVLLTVFLHLNVNSRLTNDHAGYLAMARQITFGDRPLRDFRDDGTFLHIFLSAGAQQLFGFRLLSDMLLAWTFIALGNCLTFVLSSRLSGSRWAGLAATILALLLLPRPYSFPKAFVYVLAIAVFWRYAASRTLVNVALMAGAAALALMLRVDHGVVTFAGGLVIIALAHVRRPITQVLRHAVTFAALFLICASPLLFYATLHGGVAAYLASAVALGAYAGGEAAVSLPSFLLDGGIFTEQNGLSFLFYLFGGIALGVFIHLLPGYARSLRQPQPLDFQILRVSVVLLTWLLMLPMLARDNFAVRVADIAQPVAILGAWLMTCSSNSSAASPASARRRLANALILTCTLLATLARDPARDMVRQPELVAEAPIRRSWELLEALAVSPPIDVWAPKEVSADRGLVRYLRNCTRSSDRLLVTWFAPEIYYYAGRPFAGDRWVLLAFDNAPDRQRAVVERIRSQSVPLVLVNLANLADFEVKWPALAAYLRKDYVEVAQVRGEDWPLSVLMRKTERPTHSISFMNLPCFT